jgi:hypothetical protein
MARSDDSEGCAARGCHTSAGAAGLRRAQAQGAAAALLTFASALAPLTASAGQQLSTVGTLPRIPITAKSSTRLLGPEGPVDRLRFGIGTVAAHLTRV